MLLHKRANHCWNHADQKFKNHRKSISVSWPLSVKQAAKKWCTARKSCPDASVEIALSFSLRNKRDIPCCSNSKRLVSFLRPPFLNSEFPQLRENENGINNIDLQLIDRHQSTSPKPHQSGLRLPAYGVSQKNNDIGQAYFFFPPPPPFPSFALHLP